MTMRTLWRSNDNHAQDWVSLVCAVLLFISPWAIGFSGDTTAAWTAWASAVVIGVLTVAALVQFAEWEEWVTLLVGLWLIAAPWVIGFTGLTYALATFVALGVIVALASISEIWVIRHPTPMAS